MKGAVIGVCGFVTGMSVGVLVTRSFFKNQYRSEAEAEISEMREYTKQKIDSMRNQLKVDEEGKSIELSNDIDSLKDVVDGLKYTKKDEAEYVNYKEFGKSMVDSVLKKEEKETEEDLDIEESEEEMDEYDERAEFEVPQDDRTDPYEINEDEFGNMYEFHEKHELKYFDVDDVLTDDHNVEIEDINATVGQENLDRFNAKGDPVMYVRNPSYGCDYEIIRVLSAFEDLGAGDV